MLICFELFSDLILSPSTALQDTADNFLESLDETPAQALAELINCVLRTCGCNSSVDADQVMDTDAAVDTLDEFTEGFKAVSQKHCSELQNARLLTLIFL